jgi:endonuclease/exonuclease/phosphatase family metal-dependent hydrolase
MKAFFSAVLILFSLFPAPAETLRVLTFNVRFPSKGDGPDLWNLRRDLLVETVNQLDPDVMGTQELFHEQGEYIVEKLPRLAWFGVSRRGNQEDEHMGVFYRKDRWRPVESGNYWLSERPEEAGSMSWQMSLPRMVTWALMQSLDGKRQFYLLNTHFPHRREDGAARLECAKVIASRMGNLKGGVPVILTGDFNAPADGDVYKLLTGKLEDAWKNAAERSGPEGTFHGFQGTPTGPRIDWILYKGPWKARSARTVTVNRDGRYPSDHFPVIAELDWID